MGKWRSDLQQTGAESLDETDKEAEISALLRKFHIPVVKARFLLLRDGAVKQEKSLWRDVRKNAPLNKAGTELDQSIPVPQKWLYLDWSTITVRNKTSEHCAQNTLLPVQYHRVQLAFCRMPTGSCCITQNPHTIIWNHFKQPVPLGLHQPRYTDGMRTALPLPFLPRHLTMAWECVTRRLCSWFLRRSTA